MGYGVMMALEAKDDLIAKLQAQGPTGSLPDALAGNAREFIRIRSDLAEAVRHEILGGAA
jgi:hypothetical protein